MKTKSIKKPAKKNQTMIELFDELILSILPEEYTWTKKERRLYNQLVKRLKMVGL